MKNDVAAYYDQTQNHYTRWWQLDKNLALHYGLWHTDTADFATALQNTNRYMAALAEVQPGMHVLDAGCGVGGAAIFLAQHYQVQVTGITLSQRQLEAAGCYIKQHSVQDSVIVERQDYCQTSFPDNSFDLIWACESSSSASDKQAMVREWYRLLRPGGKVVLTDFFKASEETADPSGLLDKWCRLWAMSPLLTVGTLGWYFEQAGFNIIKTEDLTDKIRKTARRMYLSCLAGALPSITYNLLFGARRYARHHYLSGIYQYHALQKGLWQYHSLLAVKK